MFRPRYVTTTIPYVNAPPHVGFALELVQADVIARSARARGVPVRLQTGTDENAFKNVLSAHARGVSVQALVDDNSARFRALAHALDISIDHFVRTTDSEHRRAVGAFLSRLRADDVYRSEYRGLYCAGCEDFYLPDDSVDGCCPEHRTPLVEIAENNWFFRLSAWQDTIRELIASRRIRIVPESREGEVLRFIDRGLKDISISRDAARSEGWGIPYPGDATQVVYVWIDALINYLSGLGFPDGEDIECYWNAASKTHVIGKNVWKFHAIYWPALLLSAGIPVPDQIVVHGFLTNEGQKISKSSGNAADPLEYIDQYGVDAVRYFLLRHVRPFDDSDFSVERLDAVYHADLANGLGNLTSRLTALCETAGVPAITDCVAAPLSAPCHEHLESFRFDLALAAIWQEVAALNREIADAKPWLDIKAGRLSAARTTLSELVTRLAGIGRSLGPLLPNTSSAIFSALSRSPIQKCEALFPRR